MMKTLLSKVRAALDFNPATGIFIWKAKPGACRLTLSYNARFAGKQAGYLRPDGYVSLCVDGTSYLAHRLAWFYVWGQFPEHTIDHCNGERSDNRMRNLRSATQSENNCNRPQRTSGLKGAWRRPSGRYYSVIGKGKTRTYLGDFATAEEAAAAYDRAALSLHGCFARPNERLS